MGFGEAHDRAFTLWQRAQTAVDGQGNLRDQRRGTRKRLFADAGFAKNGVGNCRRYRIGFSMAAVDRAGQNFGSLMDAYVEAWTDFEEAWNFWSWMLSPRSMPALVQADGCFRGGGGA